MPTPAPNRHTARLAQLTKGEPGAFDLASIIVGVVLLAVLVGGILVTVLGVIPFSQDKAARQSLDAVRIAEGVAVAQEGKYKSAAEIAALGLTSGEEPGLKVISPEGKWYCAAVRSATGKSFTVNSKNSSIIEGGCDLKWKAQTNTSSFKYMTTSADGMKLVAVQRSAATPLRRSVDAGVTWTTLTASGTTASWTGIASTADGNTLIAAENGPTGALHRSTDAGQTWTKITSAPQAGWVGVKASATGTEMLAIPEGSANFHTSRDGGATWTMHTEPAVSSGWATPAVSGDGSTMVVSIFGAHIRISTDRGVTWTRLGSGPTSTWMGMAVSHDGSQIAAAGASSTVGGIFRSDNYGATWKKLDVDPAWSGGYGTVAMSADGTQLVAGKYMGDWAVLSSNDSGKTWVQAPTTTIVGDRDMVTISGDGSRAAAGNWNGRFANATLEP